MSDALSALARKYRELEALRRAQDAGEAAATRERLGALAAEFPGALRELDRLALATIADRADALERAASGHGPIEPWMRWIGAYHALLRVVLAARARRVASDEAVGALARDASLASRVGVGPAFARAALVDRARASDLAIAAIAEHDDVDAGLVRAVCAPGPVARASREKPRG